MAASRLEKIGTIYTRATGLIKAGAVSWSDRPLWYDIYEAFPPKEEPSFDRPALNLPLKKILYEEDKIRAIFHRNNKNVGTINMFNNESKTLTKSFIDIYKKLEAQTHDDETITEQKLYKEAIDILKTERNTRREKSEEEEVDLSKDFKESQMKPKVIGLTIKDIFRI